MMAANTAETPVGTRRKARHTPSTAIMRTRHRGSHSGSGKGLLPAGLDDAAASAGEIADNIGEGITEPFFFSFGVVVDLLEGSVGSAAGPSESSSSNGSKAADCGTC